MPFQPAHSLRSESNPGWKRRAIAPVRPICTLQRAAVSGGVRPSPGRAAQARDAEARRSILRWDRRNHPDRGGGIHRLEASAGTLTATPSRSQELATSVASSSEEASSNVQSVPSATEEPSSSVNEIGRQVQESSRIANGAVHQSHSTTDRVLSKAAARIGDVVELINTIAGQTNRGSDEVEPRSRAQAKNQCSNRGRCRQHDRQCEQR